MTARFHEIRYRAYVVVPTKIGAALPHGFSIFKEIRISINAGVRQRNIVN